MAVDGLWLFCVAGALAWLIFGMPLPSAGNSQAATGARWIHSLLPAVVFIAGWRLFGVTPGKLLLELRVVDARIGGPPSWPRAIVRYLGYLVSALPLGLGFLWVLIDRRKQTFHDKLARTRVIVVEEAVLPQRPPAMREPAA